MRLSKIKIAGFKSFVDPTVLDLKSNLSGIIGPNGCGKSNTIDAVRWVMGESSAKHLRGGSMADVIFNGSSARKPVSKASVELVFDNTDGTLGGQYASFNEIAVRREVIRDGSSAYFLNGTKCRRRDITDIFLGTGLGPRSYAIIEQGMISRLIEAKPEELRVFLEEAAGISRYKERRRETENRIRHTRENLDRLNDLREEIESQLEKLKRQARTAERYKELKQEERASKLGLVALRWRDMQTDASQRYQLIQEGETVVEGIVAEQRAVESKLETSRQAHADANEVMNTAQARFYEVGADISRMEQEIKHVRELRQRQSRELEQVNYARQELAGHIERDAGQLETVTHIFAELEPRYEAASAIQTDANDLIVTQEEQLTELQNQWEEQSRQYGDVSRAVEVERTAITHLERSLHQGLQRLESMQDELKCLQEAEQGPENEHLEDQLHQLEYRRETLEGEVQQRQEQVLAQRELLRGLQQQQQAIQAERQQQLSRKMSLDAMQQAALGQGKADEATSQWLTQQGLQHASRVLEQIVVTDDRWQRAVETVLGTTLEAVLLDVLPDASTLLAAQTADVAITLVEPQGVTDVAAAQESLLANKVEGACAKLTQLQHVHMAHDLEQALALRSTLAAHESVITPEGLWLGADWLRVGAAIATGDDGLSGVLQREAALKDLAILLEQQDEKLLLVEEQISQAQAQIDTEESGRTEAQQSLNLLHRQYNETREQLTQSQGKIKQRQARAEQLTTEVDTLRFQIRKEEQESSEGRGRLEIELARLEQMQESRRACELERDAVQQRLRELREQGRMERETVHQMAIQLEARRTERDGLQISVQRQRDQSLNLEQRYLELMDSLQDNVDPVDDLTELLEERLEQRLIAEGALSDARKQLEEVESGLRDFDRSRMDVQQRLQVAQQQLDALRLAHQEVHVRQRTLEEQLAESTADPETVLADLPESATVPEWETQLQATSDKIQRLGAINLAAIDEYATQLERKEYLDAQNTDLMQALDTLEGAIRKIDKETRARFKETFDKVNNGLQALFPRLFGGGHAHLEMTGDDLLDTGVAVMARPPGKRVSNIHLLSGGEKAMTAVALVFAIFQLNPAPFCMLDEVDAPLDDANVGRFSAMVKEMSAQLQFIFISHNKVTMEIADQLLGVTMREPGVSRLVSVDLDAALEMAEISAPDAKSQSEMFAE